MCRSRACACLSVVTTVMPLLLAACDGGISAETRDKWKRFSPAQNYDIALHDESADARRRAIVRIADSGRATEEDAFRVLDVAARTDPSSQVRCAAIRALKTYWDPRPVDTLLAILNPKGRSGEALPATPEVRWDATEALARLSENAILPDPLRDEATDVFVTLLLHDTSRDVRMAAARGLGALPDDRALRALIASLRHKDFGIAYEAHGALVRLTGQTFEYDADAWEAWLKTAANPFDRTAAPASQPATTRSE